MTDILLKEKHLNILTAIFDKYCPTAKVYAYGSRVKNEAHEGSDLDLAVVNNADTVLPMNELKNAIANSTLPFLVDIYELQSLPENFQNNIIQNNVVIYEHTQQGGTCG